MELVELGLNKTQLVSMDASGNYDKNALAITGSNHTVVLLNTGEVMDCWNE